MLLGAKTDPTKLCITDLSLADTGAHQRLDCVAADAAEAENGHMAFLQPFHRVGAEKHLCA